MLASLFCANTFIQVAVRNHFRELVTKSADSPIGVGQTVDFRITREQSMVGVMWLDITLAQVTDGVDPSYCDYSILQVAPKIQYIQGSELLWEETDQQAYISHDLNTP